MKRIIYIIMIVLVALIINFRYYSDYSDYKFNPKIGDVYITTYFKNDPFTKTEYCTNYIFEISNKYVLYYTLPRGEFDSESFSWFKAINEFYTNDVKALRTITND